MSNHHHHTSGNLKLAFFLNLGFTVIEFIGGILVNSVAILSDAVHDLGDSVSLGLAWYLDQKSHQKANKIFTFGYGRFSLLGALINALILILGSFFVLSEALNRLFNPEPSNATGMILLALLGVLVNGFAAWKVSHGKSQNEKVISWHLLEDVLGWVTVLIGAIILYFYDIPWLDPALSIAITLFILWNVFKNLKETMLIFLQGSPKGISVAQIEQKLLLHPKVNSIHHVHTWSLDGENHVFTAHICLKEIDNLEELRKSKISIQQLLKSYSFIHFTIEWELPGDNCTIQSKDN
ncbi:cation diffusion facilitator family transporter [Algoriphagus hitonicola]|uniref:Cobalt-zinc-cadmium efflux system protein n=1 Tax=Algoriphagus hitonicola TaxID=435880 RepID=A0A1I2U242_9BACT|nr:cation diffusion facilitator family transporter [Algoriphagus hitonicola]SFG68956.1 cobalt-zinc-cadmium efflux system protein [Algoriphagus hitonicola]